MYFFIYSDSAEGADRSGGSVDGSSDGGLEADPKDHG